MRSRTPDFTKHAKNRYRIYVDKKDLDQAKTLLHHAVNIEESLQFTKTEKIPISQESHLFFSSVCFSNQIISNNDIQLQPFYDGKSLLHFHFIFQIGWIMCIHSRYDNAFPFCCFMKEHSDRIWITHSIGILHLSKPNTTTVQFQWNIVFRSNLCNPCACLPCGAIQFRISPQEYIRMSNAVAQPM